MYIHCSFIQNSQKLETTHYSSTGESQYIYTVEYYSQQTYINLTNMLSERSKTQKTIYFMFFHLKLLE